MKIKTPFTFVWQNQKKDRCWEIEYKSIQRKEARQWKVFRGRQGCFVVKQDIFNAFAPITALWHRGTKSESTHKGLFTHDQDVNAFMLCGIRKASFCSYISALTKLTLSLVLWASRKISKILWRLILESLLLLLEKLWVILSLNTLTKNRQLNECFQAFYPQEWSWERSPCTYGDYNI